MTKVLTFKVGIKGLEDKIWRTIEITDRRTLADLAYTILATFDSLSYHLYEIFYDDNTYHCGVCIEESPDFEEILNATEYKLSSLGLKKYDQMQMDYDFGSTTTFVITYLDSRDISEYDGYLYPNIVDGAGRGMLDDISDFELKEYVEDTDKLGYSTHYVTPGYQWHEKYDYRKFNLKTNNRKLKGLILDIKNGYEVDEDNL